jgi:hypothetical protein
MPRADIEAMQKDLAGRGRRGRRGRRCPPERRSRSGSRTRCGSGRKTLPTGTGLRLNGATAAWRQHASAPYQCRAPRSRRWHPPRPHMNIALSREPGDILCIQEEPRSAATTPCAKTATSCRSPSRPTVALHQGYRPRSRAPGRQLGDLPRAAKPARYQADGSLQAADADSPSAT